MRVIVIVEGGLAVQRPERRDRIEPEKTNTYEVGFRFGEGQLTGVIAGYLVNFQNRLLAIPQGPGIGVSLDDDKVNFYRRDRTVSAKVVAGE